MRTCVRTRAYFKLKTRQVQHKICKTRVYQKSKKIRGQNTTVCRLWTAISSTHVTSVIMTSLYHGDIVSSEVFSLLLPPFLSLRLLVQYSSYLHVLLFTSLLAACLMVLHSLLWSKKKCGGWTGCRRQGCLCSTNVCEQFVCCEFAFTYESSKQWS